MTTNNVLIAAGDNAITGVLQNNITRGIDGLTPASQTNGVAFSPDGSLLAIAHGFNKGLSVFNTSNWTEVAAVLPYLSSGSNAVAFSPDGAFLAVVYPGGDRLKVFNTVDWTEVTGLPTLPSDGYDCKFSPDGAFLATAHFSGHGITVIDTSTWLEVAANPYVAGMGLACSFSLDSSLLAIGHTSNPYLEIFNTSDWTKVTGTPSVAGLSNPYAIDFSPDGIQMAVGFLYSPYLKIYNTSTWAEVAGTPTAAGRVVNLAYSPDGSLLAVAHQNGEGLSIFNTSDWTKVTGTPSLSGNGNGVAFSPVPLAVPSRAIETRDYGGNQITAEVALLSRDYTAKKLLQSSGQLTLYYFGGGDYWLIMKDDRDGATKDAFARITLDATSGDLPPLVLTQGYIGTKVTISSNLTTQAGAAGDEVIIRNWTTRELVAKVIPDANGDWSAEVPPGTYDVSYIAENCAPVIHGPYTVELP